MELDLTATETTDPWSSTLVKSADVIIYEEPGIHVAVPLSCILETPPFWASTNSSYQLLASNLGTIWTKLGSVEAFLARTNAVVAFRA